MLQRLDTTLLQWLQRLDSEKNHVIQTVNRWDYSFSRSLNLLTGVIACVFGAIVRIKRWSEGGEAGLRITAENFRRCANPH
jgi:hypothetical protein